MNVTIRSGTKHTRWLSSITALLLVFFAVTMLGYGLDFTVATSYDRAFPDKWIYGSSSSLQSLSANDTVYHGVPINVYIFFQQYARNSFGITDISFSYKILRSNGTPVTESTGIPAFTGIVYPDDDILLSRNSPRISFSKKEVQGNYTLVVTAEDKINDAKKTISKTIILSKYPQMDPDRFDVVSFNVWVHNYCIAPDPGRAVSAFAWFINSKSSNDDRVFWPVFYFFQSLFTDNPSLVEELIGTFPHASKRFQEYTVMLVRLIQVKRNGKWPITDALWKSFDKVTRTGYLDPFTVTLKSGSAQYMEMGFYCYGHYAMVRFLIECCGLNTQAGYDEFVKRCDEYVKGCEAFIDKKIALKLCADAKLILSKAYNKHKLIHAYCDFALANDTVSPYVKKVVADLINGGLGK